MKKCWEMIIKYYNKYKELTNYVIFGVLTTLVNYIVYILSTRLLSLSVVISTGVAWLLAVLFAYLTNRKYVFNSKVDSKINILKEAISFFLFRILSGVIEVIVMYIAVDLMGINDIVMKLLSNILVIALNYIFSKLFIFNSKRYEFNNLEKEFTFDSNNKPTRFFRYIVQTVMLIVSAYILYLNFSIMSFVIIVLAFVIIDILLFKKKIFIREKKDNKQKLFNNILKFLDNNYHYVILIIAFAIRIMFYLKLQIVPRSDFAAVLNAAKSLISGVNILNDSPYFIRWAYQTGIVVYNATVIGILGSEMWLHILDCIYGSAVCLFIYLIAKEIFSKRAAQIVSILYCIGIYVSAFCGVLSNQHIFSVFILMAFYLLIAKKYSDMNWIIKYCIIAGLIAISNIFRTEAIVYVAVLLAYIFIKSLGKETYKKGILSIVLVLLIYLVINKSASFIVKATGLNNNGLENKDILWKFVCASDYSVGGGYSKEGAKLLLNSEAEKQFIKKNLSSLSLEQYVNFFQIKENEFWHNIPYYWVFYEVENKSVNILNKEYKFSEIRKLIEIYDATIFLFAVISMTIFVLYDKINKVQDKRIYLLYFGILANFFVYLLIEVNGRYSYLAKVFVYILAAGGIDLVYNKLKESKKTKELD